MTLLTAIVISSIAAVTDIRSRRIPNWLTYSAILLGVGYHTIVNGPQGFFFGAGGLFLGLALLIVFYLAGGMGAGDVKLWVRSAPCWDRKAFLSPLFLRRLLAAFTRSYFFSCVSVLGKPQFC